jgi:small-conductance mechanosensitive channel
VKTLQLNAFVDPAMIIVAAVLAGLIFERFVLTYLERLVEKTKWEGDSILIEALRGKIYLLSAVLGLYIAVPYASLKPNILDPIETGLMVVLLLIATVALSQMAVGFVNMYTREALPSSSLLSNLAKFSVYIIGLLTILEMLGISIAPMLTALGIGGIGAALALQDTLGNLFSGLHVLAEKQTKIGDYIKLDSGQEGYIQDITWRNTVLKALPDNLVIIPNTKLSGSIITNYSRPECEMSVLLDVGVAYDSDLEKVEQITIAVAKEVMRDDLGAVTEFQPLVRFHTFGDSRIDFTVILRSREFVDQYLLKHEFIKKLHKRYDQEGIEIPFPIRTVHLQGDSSLTVGK